MRESEILPGTFCEKMKSAWKGAEVKDTFLLGPSKNSVEVKGIFLPGTFCDKTKRAWKGAEVK